MNSFTYFIYKIYMRLKRLISFNPNFHYENMLKLQSRNVYPKVISIEESLNELINSNKSLVRFGDGEFSLCFNNDLSFQKANTGLNTRLREILKSENKNCMIAIVDANVEMKTDYSINFWSSNSYPISTLLKNKDNYYYEANIFRHLNLNQYQKLKQLWKNKAVIFVVGKKSRFVFDKSLFEGVTKHSFIYGKAQNAWDEYNHILGEVCKQSENLKNDIIVLIALGPTASVLCYDLSLKGIRAIDIGHISNQYLRLLNKGQKPENMPISQ